MIVLTLLNNIFRQGTEKLHCVHLCFFCTWPLKDMFQRSVDFHGILIIKSSGVLVLLFLWSSFCSHIAPMMYLNFSSSKILFSCSLMLCLENNLKRLKSSPQSGQMNILALASSSVQSSSPWEVPVLDNDRELSCSSSQLLPPTCSSRTWLVP